MVVKIIELIGISEHSFEDAVRVAVKRANQTVKHVSGVDVIGQSCKVENGEVTEFKVNLKVAFLVEEEE